MFILRRRNKSQLFQWLVAVGLLIVIVRLVSLRFQNDVIEELAEGEEEEGEEVAEVSSCLMQLCCCHITVRHFVGF